MKGKILRCVVSDSALDANHGFRYSIHRLLVPDANDLVVTPHRGTVYAWEGGDMTDGCQEVAEVEVSDELVAAAQALIKSKEDLTAEVVGASKQSLSSLSGYFLEQFGERHLTAA